MELVVLFDRKKVRYVSFGYVKLNKSNKVIKRKKFNIKIGDAHGLVTDIKKEFLYQDFDKLNVENFSFKKRT